MEDIFKASHSHDAILQLELPLRLDTIDLEGGREGGRERGREGGREGEREGGREGGRDGWMEGGRNGWR